uniref:Uncharacterized protein n=1 Tax=viral metagenome TaxID=1070528 RepID=A0A6M3LIW0_9ZZZZ
MAINDKAWDGGFRRAIGDPSLGATLALALDATTRQLHICEIADAGTDWARTASSHPELCIHSATTPATMYLKMYHDATNAYIDAVGATTLQLLVAGTAEISVAAASVSPTTTNGAALGTGSLMWSDLFLASGGVINFNNSDLTLTHSAGTLTGAVTAPASVATTPGTAAGTMLTLVGGVGGATSIATTGAGGIGGGFSITGGAGGLAASAATASTGGAGGAFAVTTGAGGAAGATGAGTATGGAAGAITLTGGVGGAIATSTGTNTGGVGGSITLTGGAGGSGTAGTSTGGAGGSITLVAGAGGTGDTGGAAGTIAVTGALTCSSTVAVTTSVDCGGSCEANAYTVGGTAGTDESGSGTITTFTCTIVKGIVTAFAKVS